MGSITQSTDSAISTLGAQNQEGLFSSETVLDILRMILAGAPLAEVLTIIAKLVESRGDGTLCSIWLPDESGRHLRCATAPSLPGFIAHMGAMLISPDKGGTCGAAVFRREPVFATDILNDPVWDHCRHLLLPFGIRAVWSRPLIAGDGKVLGTFAIHYREARSPGKADLEPIENASHIAGIAIERHINEQKLRQERDRLGLLLQITNSMTSKLDLSHLLEALSTSLLGVTRSNLCALLLPDADRKQLRVKILYNSESRGAICDGTLVPIKGSTCGKAFLSGRNQLIRRFEDFKQDPESFGRAEGQAFFEQMAAEGLKSGCELPLIGRKV